MTYKQLLEVLQNASNEILEQDVTVHLSQVDEYLPLNCVTFSGDDVDVLDSGHLFLDVNF